MTISALPTPPARTDAPSVFIGKADAFIAALPTFVSEANALAIAADADAATATSGAATATTKADEAAASAAQAAAASGVVKWVSGTTYAEGDGVWSPLKYQSYRRIIAGAGTTDPSLDHVNWALIGDKAVWAIKTTTYTAVAGDCLQCDTTSAAFTVTLPAAPSANDVVRIADYAGTFATNNLTLGRNSTNIMGLAEDMVLDINHASISLTYIDATKGWGLT